MFAPCNFEECGAGARLIGDGASQPAESFYETRHEHPARDLARAPAWLFDQLAENRARRDSGNQHFAGTADQIDARWDQIKQATGQGHLGIAAKAATARQNPRATSRAKLICVYTRDWQDHGDVRRVLYGLRKLGVSWRLSYKTDEATGAGVYGRGSSLYVSQKDSTDFEDRVLRGSRTRHVS